LVRRVRLCGCLCVYVSVCARPCVRHIRTRGTAPPPCPRHYTACSCVARAGSWGCVPAAACARQPAGTRCRGMCTRTRPCADLRSWHSSHTLQRAALCACFLCFHVRVPEPAQLYMYSGMHICDIGNVCMYVYIYTSKYLYTVCMSVYIYTSKHLYTVCIYVYIYTSKYLYTVCMSVYIYRSQHLHISISIYLYASIYLST